MNFKQNFSLLDLSTKEIADDLRTTSDKIEDPWILKNYLEESLLDQRKTPIPFTALVGDYHDYWFLDASKIEKRKFAK